MTSIADRARWYFRVVEREDGSWMCRRGRHTSDTHPTLDDAITHIVAAAVEHPPSEVVIHYWDGRVRSHTSFD